MDLTRSFHALATGSLPLRVLDNWSVNHDNETLPVQHVDYSWSCLTAERVGKHRVDDRQDYHYIARRDSESEFPTDYDILCGRMRPSTELMRAQLWLNRDTYNWLAWWNLC